MQCSPRHMHRQHTSSSLLIWTLELGLGLGSFEDLTDFEDFLGFGAFCGLVVSLLDGG